MSTQSTATSSPARPSASSNSCLYFAARLYYEGGRAWCDEESGVVIGD